MSYSFSAQAATKAELKTKVAEQLAAVVLAQPVHAAVYDGLRAMLRLVERDRDAGRDDAARDAAISMHGSVWSTDAGMQSAEVSITAGFQPRT